MRKLIILSLFTLPLGCSEDDFTDTYGTSCLLSTTPNGVMLGLKNYQYQPDGRLASEKDFRSLGWRYYLQYEDTVLRRVFTYEITSGALSRRDSMTYTSDGQSKRPMTHFQAVREKTCRYIWVRFLI